MIRETMGQHNEHRTLVENLNREFGSFVPEYARVDPEIFDALDDLGRTIDNIPKPGIRERTAISRAFKQRDARLGVRRRLRPDPEFRPLSGPRGGTQPCLMRDDRFGDVAEQLKQTEEGAESDDDERTDTHDEPQPDEEITTEGHRVGD